MECSWYLYKNMDFLKMCYEIKEMKFFVLLCFISSWIWSQAWSFGIKHQEIVYCISIFSVGLLVPVSVCVSSAQLQGLLYLHENTHYFRHLLFWSLRNSYKSRLSIFLRNSWFLFDFLFWFYQVFNIKSWSWTFKYIGLEHH